MICKQCFGLDSCGDEQPKVLKEFGHWPEIIGDIPITESWDTFYREASVSPKIFLIKTHLPPRDSCPVIYIVRDGRAAIQSYHFFHLYCNNIDISMTNLIVGNDVYGDWSDHYRNWIEKREGKKFIIRYEDMTDISDALLSSLANFIGYDGLISKWSNPFEELKKMEPFIFQNIKKDFQPNKLWGDQEEFLFVRVHGELMKEFGYFDEQYIASRQEVGNNHLFYEIVDELLALNKSFLIEKKQFHEICDQRLKIIESLKETCDERLALINRFSGLNSDERGLSSND